jgi:hypothetical protein
VHIDKKLHYYYYFVVIIIVVVVVSCHRPFLPGTSPEPTVIPNAQGSSCCSTFRITCDVPSTAVVRSEYIECLPGVASKCFLRHFVTILVAPIITGMMLHFMFHIRCISAHKVF